MTQYILTITAIEVANNLTLLQDLNVEAYDTANGPYVNVHFKSEEDMLYYMLARIK